MTAHSVSKSFDQDDALEDDIESEWIIGSGTISSSVDEIRISATNRSSDWILATYENQRLSPSFPSKANSLTGPPSFTSDRDFTIFSGEPFNHMAEATGEPLAYVANGLPIGLLLSPVDGNLSGVPTMAGIYTPTLRAVYADGSSALENYSFNVLASPPQISISVPQGVDASSLLVPFEILSTGGEDPVVLVVADTVDQGTDLYKWQFRFDLGPMGLGTGSTILVDLAPDRSYYIRLYAYNSAGDAWTGKQFEIVTQPESSPTYLLV